jgi:hypothetical protein
MLASIILTAHMLKIPYAWAVAAGGRQGGGPDPGGDLRRT